MYCVRGVVKAQRMTVAFFLGAVASLVSGCSLHPLPEDYADLPTTKITRHIRCEAKQALQQIVANYLIKSNDSATAEVGFMLLRKPSMTSSALKHRLHPETIKRIDFFEKAGIGYEFRFKMTENNDNGGGLTLSLPFTNGSVAIKLSALKKHTRENTRRFVLLETFGELVDGLDCSQTQARGPSFAYPITGRVGLREVISTFIDLSISGNLDSGKQEVNDFTELLTFTTELSSTVNPTLKLDSVADRMRVTEANATSTMGRKDLHEVTIALNMPVKDKPGAPPKSAARQKSATKDALRQILKDSKQLILEESFRELEDRARQQ